ncbi:MAG: hypothetical protein KDC07_09915 [Chitinophagaceae bacterium]|nr:hypothetical protein [Chitinophagaceae bacterium]MCB9046000.1 hypothetical protein [Chitinophagales bacterium]
MKRNYLLRLTTSLVLAMGISWLAYNGVIWSDRKYFHSIAKNEFVFLEDTTTYDILLLGSSRVKNMVNPRVVDSVTKLNSFNAGASGANALEMKTILESYLLQHRPPKYMVLTLDLYSLENDRSLQYYPSYITCAASSPIEKALKNEGVHTYLYKYLPFLKLVELNDYYKGIVVKSLKGQTDIGDGDYYYKGYVSNTDVEIEKDELKPLRFFGVTQEGIDAVGDIINICRQKNIELVLTYAPEYKKFIIRGTPTPERIFKVYDSIATVNNIPYLRHENLALSTDPQLFANNGHLNKRGADVYSEVLSEQLITLGFIQ